MRRRGQGRSGPGPWAAAFLSSLVLLGVLVSASEGVAPWQWLAALVSGAHGGRAFPFLVVWGGAWALILGHVVLCALVARGPALPAVSRLAMDQAVRGGGAILPMAILLLVLAFLPTAFVTETPLRYRVQSYLTYSQAITAVFAGLLVVVLACRSVTLELGERRQGELFVRPLRTRDYVLGKWLGTVLMSGLVVAVCSGVAYSMVRFDLARMEATDEYDALALREDVLTARRVVGVVKQDFSDAVERGLERHRRESPGWIEEHGGENVVAERLRREAQIAWWSLPGAERRTYTVTGLRGAKDSGDSFQLRLRFDRPPESAQQGHGVRVEIGDESRTLAAGTNVTPVLSFPTTLVGDQGELSITLVNEDAENQLSLSARGGLLVFYVESSFASNFLRASVAGWVKLAFLGALAVFAGTFLSFSVGSILVVTVWLTAALGSELDRAVRYIPRHGHRASGESMIYDYFVTPLAGTLAKLLERYSSLNTSQRLVEGQVIDWSELLQHCFWIGLVWAPLCVGLGWLVLRRRELARVQV